MIATNEHGPERIKGWHVLAGLVAFFGVVFVVNGVFLYQALSTHTGVIAQEPYRKGLAYNERIAAEEQQKALRWSEEITLAATGDHLSLRLEDAEGSPIRGLKVVGFIGRPATTDHDVALDMTQAADGTYGARFAALPAGTLMVSLEASELTADGERIVWRARKRLWRTP